MGLSAYPTDAPLHLGMPGMHGTYAANMAIQHADLLLGLGVRFDDRVTGSLQTFAPGARIVHLDIDPAEFNKNVRVDWRLQGDLKWSLGLLIERAEAGAFSPNIAYWQAAAVGKRSVRSLTKIRQKLSNRRLLLKPFIS